MLHPSRRGRLLSVQYAVSVCTGTSWSSPKKCGGRTVLGITPSETKCVRMTNWKIKRRDGTNGTKLKTKRKKKRNNPEQKKGTKTKRMPPLMRTRIRGREMKCLEKKASHPRSSKTRICNWSLDQLHTHPIDPSLHNLHNPLAKDEAAVDFSEQDSENPKHNSPPAPNDKVYRLPVPNHKTIMSCGC